MCLRSNVATAKKDATRTLFAFGLARVTPILARVTPIFKSGSKSEANNYRHLSVISVFSRILERIIDDQVYEYLKANKVLTMSQSAFQKLCATVTSLIDSTDHWYGNIENKQLNLAIFLDLRKAFDTVDHRILL